MVESCISSLFLQDILFENNPYEQCKGDIERRKETYNQNYIDIT